MKKRKIVRTGSAKIKIGKSLNPMVTWKYPFDDLKEEGNYFIVRGRALENSVRSQASKNQVSRGVRYTVSRVKKGQVLSDGTVIKDDGLVVRLADYAQ